MTACACDSHTTSTSTPALTSTSTSSGDCLNLVPGSNANGLNCTITSGFMKCINVAHNGSAGGVGVNSTTNGGTAIYGSSVSGIGISAFCTNFTALSANSTNSNGIVANSSSTSPGIAAVKATGSWTGVAATGNVCGLSGSLAGTGAGYGTYGYASTTNTGAYAGYFEGRVKVTNSLVVGTTLSVSGNTTITGGGALTVDGNVSIGGFLTKGGGTFTIDHPSDPKNKILNHSFVESPDMKNVYDGRGVLNSNGFAAVKLPDYFSDLNENFCYQLTMIGGRSPSIRIGEEINECKKNEFSVSGEPRQKFCWQVTGSRKDAFAQAHRVIPEVMKEGDAVGKYLHPEAFGLKPNNS